MCPKLCQTVVQVFLRLHLKNSGNVAHRGLPDRVSLVEHAVSGTETVESVGCEFFCGPHYAVVDVSRSAHVYVEVEKTSGYVILNALVGEDVFLRYRSFGQADRVVF